MKFPSWLGRCKRPSSALSYDLFSLDRPLIQFSPADVWTVRDACEGVQVFGGIGSGKISGSGAAIAKSFLRGALVGWCCVLSQRNLRFGNDMRRRRDTASI